MSHAEAVLISIQPKWCEEIFITKHKNVELRKSWPTKLAMGMPFKAYVYCTAARFTIMDVIHKGEAIYNDEVWENETPLFIRIPDDGTHMYSRKKKVIGEMLIDRILELDFQDGKALVNGREVTKEDKIHTRVTMKNFLKYKKNGKVYGWHIADTKLYVKPRELEVFGLKRPPQSWQYLEASEPWDRREKNDC